MIRKPSPKAMWWAVSGAVDQTLWRAVSGAVNRAVEGAVYRAVWETVSGPVWGAVYRAVRFSPSHPNLHLFLVEIRQTQGGAL